MAISKIITSSLTDDAVTSAKIGTDQVGADALSSSAISGAVDIPANSVGQSELSIDLSAQSVPHIIPDVLYPSYVASGTSNKLLDGTTDHSGAFGTEQSDGRKYYYTNIAGSKPIKDPRIGAHFGSQRHKFKSLQKLEQETATHGNDVFSIDGREWCRAVGGNDAVVIKNDDDGHYIQTQSTAGTIEITGYFNAVNLLAATWMTATNTVLVAINGVTAHSTFALNASGATPLGNRYVDQSSVYNIDITSSSSLSADTSLGINTIKIKHVTGDSKLHGIELIVQDTSSTANRSKIQIPAQNVVSFGKKFPISATAVHYDPFTTMSYGGSGTTLSNLQSLIDTDTSLGMDAWKAGTSNYHRPWNGGRVIKWVDSSGTIKTSVNMMPPNAQNIGTTASNAVSDAHVIAGTNDDTINFNTSAVDHTQAEVAKTWNCYEFGNGNANGGHDGTYKDATMLDASGFDDIAYVMDDGVSSLVIDNARQYDLGEGIYMEASKSGHITFIGTGISIYSSNSGVEATKHIAQNLPYGTHVLKIATEASHNVTTLTLNGVQLNSSATHFVYAHFEDITFHQPKRPPIPEDCVVLADYMLMADFVPQTDGALPHISKGVRWCSSSRDGFYNSGASLTYNQSYVDRHIGATTIYTNLNGYSLSEGRFTAFGHAFGCHYDRDTDRTNAAKVQFDGSLFSYNASNIYGSGTAINSSSVIDKSGSVRADVYGIKNQTLGNHAFGDKTDADPGSNKYNPWSGWQVATPIHTSSHYQAFETPLLHELVGGDRNMEQTNLVCSPDGKTWDEVTRDVSYIGNAVLKAAHANTYGNVVNIFDDWRGGVAGTYNGEYFNKDFAIAYDRMICLKEGNYMITFLARSATNDDIAGIRVNNQIIKMHKSLTGEKSAQTTVTINLKRDDYVQGIGVSGGGTGAYEILTSFQIIRL